MSMVKIRSTSQHPLPSDERIASLCKTLETRFGQEILNKRYAPIKHVLTMIGNAGLLGMALVSPGAAQVGKLIRNQQRVQKQRAYEKYNPYFLNRSIRRLHQQKSVEIRDDGDTQVVVLTQAGKRRILKYALEYLTIPEPKTWDGRWRLIIYDVDDRKKKLRDVFRRSLRGLGFYKLQESIWLYPHPCEEQIAFLREYHGVGNEVIYVVASKLQDDTPYRRYFGLT